MADLSLPYAAYLDAVREEADRLVQAAEGNLGAAVPSCPSWRVADLVDHLTALYGSFLAQVQAAEPAERAPRERLPPPGSEREALDGLEVAGATLVRALEAAGPEAPCWNWSGEDLVTGWVARRMALETAVHRVDAELAAGRARPVEAELAADGLEERIALFLRRDVDRHPEATLGGSLCLVASDVPAAFLVEVAHGRLRWRAGRGPADAAVVGTASDLFLFSWNRLPLEALELTGHREVAEAWRELPA